VWKVWSNDNEVILLVNINIINESNINNENKCISNVWNDNISNV